MLLHLHWHWLLPPTLHCLWIHGSMWHLLHHPWYRTGISRCRHHRLLVLHHVVVLGIRGHAIWHRIGGHAVHGHRSSRVTRIPRWCHMIAGHPLMHWRTLCRVWMCVHHMLRIHRLSVHWRATHSRMCVWIGTTNCCRIRSVAAWHRSLLIAERLRLLHM